MTTVGSGTAVATISLFETTPAVINIQGVMPGTSALQLGKTEDAAHVSGDVGVLALAVRNDTYQTRANADGDNNVIATNLPTRAH